MDKDHFEELKAYIAKIGSSTDVSRYLSLDLFKPIDVSTLSNTPDSFSSMSTASPLRPPIIQQSRPETRIIGSPPSPVSSSKKETDFRRLLSEMSHADPDLYHALLDHEQHHSHDLSILDSMSPSNAKKQREMILNGSLQSQEFSRWIASASASASASESHSHSHSHSHCSVPPKPSHKM